MRRALQRIGVSGHVAVDQPRWAYVAPEALVHPYDRRDARGGPQHADVPRTPITHANNGNTYPISLQMHRCPPPFTPDLRLRSPADSVRTASAQGCFASLRGCTWPTLKWPKKQPLSVTNLRPAPSGPIRSHGIEARHGRYVLPKETAALAAAVLPPGKRTIRVQSNTVLLVMK